MPEVWCAPGKIHLRCGDETKVLWKPLLTQNPAMGSSELLAQLDFAGSTPHFRLTVYRQGGYTIYPKAGRLAARLGQIRLPVEKNLDRCCLPCLDSAIPSVGRIQASYAVIHMQERMTNPDLNLRYVPDLRLKCNLTSRYFTFSANISRKLTVRIPPEIQMARNPRCMERFPPIPAPIAKKKMIPK